MGAVAPEKRVDELLSADFLAHLELQLESARRMLETVLQQGAAIRRRDVQNVVRLAGTLQAEMHRREVIEHERMALLDRAAVRLGIGSADVSLTLLEALMDDGSADLARARSAALRGMLSEVHREHRTNRLLMQQELAFLDHLLRLAGGAGGYDAGGEHISASGRRTQARTPVFDVEA